MSEVLRVATRRHRSLLFQLEPAAARARQHRRPLSHDFLRRRTSKRRPTRASASPSPPSELPMRMLCAEDGETGGKGRRGKEGRGRAMEPERNRERSSNLRGEL